MGTGRMRCALYPDFFIFYGVGRQLFARRYRRIALRTMAQLAARESAAQAFPNIVVEK